MRRKRHNLKEFISKRSHVHLLSHITLLFHVGLHLNIELVPLQVTVKPGIFLPVIFHTLSNFTLF